MNKRFKGMGGCILIILFIEMVNLCGTACADTKKLAILPFAINAKKEFIYLQSGILDILEFRVTCSDTVSIIPKKQVVAAISKVLQQLQDDQVKAVGKSLNADYIIYGSLTILGNSANVNAKLFYLKDDKPPVVFFKQTDNIDKVIPQINYFASIVSHRLCNADSGNLAAKQTEVDDSAEAFILPQKTSVFSNKVWKSNNLKLVVNGIAIADVNQDQKNELIIATADKLLVGKMNDGKLGLGEVILESEYGSILSVDAADINGNGIAEIYVSNLSGKKDRANSFVLEWDGTQYAKILDQSVFLFQIMRVTNQKPRLLGQRLNRLTLNPFDNNIEELKWENSEIQEKIQVLPQKKANVLGMAQGYFLNPNQVATVVYTPEDYLAVYDDTGEALWKSRHKYGGSPLFWIMQTKDNNYPEEKQYIPLRLQVYDTNQDGVEQVIVIRNEEKSGRLFKQLRQYIQTHVEALVWDGVGLQTAWKTQLFSGHMRDFCIGDFDNDQKPELVLAVTVREKSLLQAPLTLIYAYDLN